ncbi:hypothetical protein [Flavobacterium beibuense]|uniref:hypothetical protein n=1 Tax=Flavobacterium beibuense TaxID=657326 RepID=UPI003A8D97B6
MKDFSIVLILLLWPAALLSQSYQIMVIDSVTKEPLELATLRLLKNDYILFSNNKGSFDLKLTQEEEAEISYIGYKTKKIIVTQKDTIVNLIPQPNFLSEIVLEKTVNYTHSKKIKSENRPDQYFGFQFGTENCTYIPNKEKKRGKVTEITLYHKKLRSMNFVDSTLGRDKNCKGCKVDYLASYKICFYEYDSSFKKPGAIIYDKEIIVYPKNTSGKFTINLDSLSVPFPANGICVGVEIINTKYNEPKSTFAFIGPTLGFYEYKENGLPKSWIRHRNEGWKFTHVTTRYDKGKMSNAMAIDISIKN